MKKLLFFLLFSFPFLLLAQDYPDSWKMRLRDQTTSKGLVNYGDGSPSYTPDGGLYDLWAYQDTTNQKFFVYNFQLAQWDSLAFYDDFTSSIDTAYVIQDSIIKFERIDGTTFQDTISAASGGGDMFKSVYDPNTVEDDAFDHVNHYGEYIDFDTTYGVIPTQTGRISWDSIDRTISIRTGLNGTAIQAGQEVVQPVYNNSGGPITNGQVLYVNGVYSDYYLAVTLASSSSHVTSPRDILIATTDIAAGEIGFAVELIGKVRDLNTSGLSFGEIWLSTTPGAVTNTKPSFPNYQVSLGGVVKVHATEGIIQARLDGYSPNQTAINYFNGTVRESFDFTVSESGGTITGTLEQAGGSGGDLTMMFTDGFTILDCTPAQTITLTAGTDAAPVMNYIYIPQSTKTLTVSTSDWPSGEHIRIADVLLQSATATNTYDALANRNWNDHLQGTDGQGGHSHVGQWIRNRHAAWYSGTAGTITIVGASSPDDVYFSNTAGKVFQKHLQDFDASDMATGSTMFVVNHPTTAYTPITNLNTQLTDASGGSMSGNYFNIVVWGVNNKTGESDQIMVNLPTGSYGSLASAISDVSSYNVFDIPTDFTGKGFLIAKYTFKHSAPGGGTWVLENTVDLRGKTPSTAGGGVGGGGATDFLSLTDTPSSYSGEGGKVATVNGGETALEFTDIPIETISDGNTIDLTLTGTDLTGEVIISSDSGNRLTTGTDNALHVPAEVDGSITNERDTVTVLSQDSILVYTRYGAYLKQDTIRVPGSGSGHDAVTLAGLYDYLTLSNQEITLNAIDLTTDVSGILPSGNIGAHNHTESDITDLTHTPFQTYAHSGVSSYQNTLSDGGGSFTLTSDGIVYISQISGVVQIGATEVDGSITNEIQDADEVDITDAGGYYTSTEVEGALQELGASSGSNIYNTDGSLTGNRELTGTTYSLNENYVDGGNSLSMLRSADTTYFLHEFDNNVQAYFRQTPTSSYLYRRGLTTFDSTSYISLNNTGLINLNGGLKLAKGSSFSSTGTQNDYQLPSSNDVIFKWIGSSALTLTGIDVSGSGAGFNANENIVMIVNNSSGDNDIILKYNDTGSTLGNRFNSTPGNVDLTVGQGETVIIATNGDSGGGWGVIGGTAGVDSGAAGEANTASNAGTGTSIFYQKSGVDLQFNGLNSVNGLLTIGLDAVNHNVDFTLNESLIDHDNLTNFTTDEHFLQSAISIPLSQGANDVTATSSELNLLDLSGLTAGWGLRATGATTAAWSQFNTSDFNNDAGFITSASLDGNGVFDGANDNGTIPSGFNANLTNTLTLGNFFYLNESGDQVGIGTSFTSPEAPLHIYTASAGTVTATSAPGLILEDDFSNYLQFQSLSGPAGFVFGDSGDDDIGGLWYDHTDNSFKFKVNGTANWGVLSSTLLTAGNYDFNIDETVGAGQDNYVLTYDNGTGEIGLEAAAGGADGNGIYDGSGSLSGNTIVTGGSFNMTWNAIGNFDVNGPTTLTADATSVLDVTTSKILANAEFLEIDGSTGSESELRFLDDGNSDYVGFRSPDNVTEVGSYILPAADGTANQVLQTNGTFGLSWADAGGADGNGIFDATNDGGTVPTDYQVTLTDDLDLDFLTLRGASNRAGINILAPESELHVLAASAGTVSAFADAQIVVENSGHSYMQFQYGATSNGGLIFGNSADNDEGLLIYDANDNEFQFTVGGGAGVEMTLSETDLNVLNYTFDADQTLGAGQDNYVLTYDNGTGLFSAEAASGGADGDGIYDGSGTVPTTTAVTLTDNINFDSGTLYVDGAANEVGMGTTSPDAPLHIFDAGEASLNVTPPTGTQFIIEGGATTPTDAFINLQSSTAAESGIHFSTNAGANAAKFEFDPTFNWLTFSFGGTSRYQFDASELTARNYDFDIDQTVGSSQDNYVLTYDNSDGQISLEAVSAPTILTAYKTVDETINNDDVYNDDTDLTFSLEASSAYAFEAYIIANSDATPDLKFAWTRPTGTVMVYSFDHTSVASSTWGASSSHTVAGSGSNTSAFLKGVITTDTTSGTFAFKWRQNTSDAGNTTLKKGSYIKLTKLN